jgi:hypothetical protein
MRTMTERLSREAIEEKKKKSAAVAYELEEYGLSGKTSHVLARAVFRETIELEHAGDLAKIPDEELSDLHKFGKSNLREVRSHFPYQTPKEIFPGLGQVGVLRQEQFDQERATAEGMPENPHK